MHWVTSDPHYFHTNIIKYCDRGFVGVEQMNQTLIDRWNECVGRSDTAYILGDLGMTEDSRLVDILKQLKGNKHLIIGNHDKCARRSADLRACFVNAAEIPTTPNSYVIKEINYKGQNFVLSHFPLETWHGQHRGPKSKIHLHGHCHGNLAKHHVIPNRWDVGVDCAAGYGFKPFTPIPLTYFIEHFDPTERYSNDGET